VPGAGLPIEPWLVVALKVTGAPLTSLPLTLKTTSPLAEGVNVPAAGSVSVGA
jgi:hypothetical protein